MDINVQDRHIFEEDKILVEDVDEDDEILDEENEESCPTFTEQQQRNPGEQTGLKADMWGSRTDTD
eukprot:36695-Ditylum_brightwellii.AAC.1